jgi:hypothetical protein
MNSKDYPLATRHDVNLVLFRLDYDVQWEEILLLHLVFSNSKFRFFSLKLFNQEILLLQIYS